MKAPSIPGGGMLERIPRVQRVMLLVFLVLVGTVLVGVSMIYTPWQQKRAEMERLYGEELQRANIISTIKNQEEQLANREKFFLLESGETSVLTSEITRIASKTGVAIESVVPQNDARIGSYTKLQIRVVGAAVFSDLLRFIYALEKHEPVLKIDQLEIGDVPHLQSDEVYRRPDASQASTTRSTDRQKVKLLISAFTPERRSAS